ncbi:hypothetical protein vseg_014113 [Gypsophila vaccaria]
MLSYLSIAGFWQVSTFVGQDSSVSMCQHLLQNCATLDLNCHMTCLSSYDIHILLTTVMQKLLVEQWQTYSDAQPNSDVGLKPVTTMIEINKLKERMDKCTMHGWLWQNCSFQSGLP